MVCWDMATLSGHHSAGLGYLPGTTKASAGCQHRGYLTLTVLASVPSTCPSSKDMKPNGNAPGLAAAAAAGKEGLQEGGQAEGAAAAWLG